MNDYILTAVGIAALATALTGWLKWVRPKWHRAKHDVTASRDSILGRAAVVDSITGAELSPALQGIGQRVATLEESQAAIGDALGQLANSSARLDSHDARIDRLEKSEQDRSLARTESIELLRTIESAIHSSPGGNE